MKIAYLILAHNTPNHLRRLISALSSDSCSFFIHVDKKSSVDDFESIKGKNIYFTQKRVPVFWGDFSQVEAILILIQAALTHRYGFDRFVLLSGADYPLRTVSYIENFFRNNRDKEFINLVAMPSEVAGKPISRLVSYKFRPGETRISKFTRKMLIRAGILPVKRDYKAYLRDFAPYGGSTWWALSREACDFILIFVSNERKVVNFFKNTICPDESFFQTILGNSHFRTRIARSLTYSDWSAGESNPAYITENHLAFLKSTLLFPPDNVYGGGEMLFARKFPDDSGRMVARLEKQIVENEGR